MIVIGGSTSQSLAKEIADNLGCKYIEASTKLFPDGEVYTRVETESLDDEVVIVQNTFPNDKLVEMFLLQDIVAGMNAKKVTLAIPYFGYARQDRLFNPGEPSSAKLMCKLLGSLACDKIITVDIHKESVLECLHCEHIDLKAGAAIANYFDGKGIDLVLAPDIGAANRAKDVGMRLEIPFDHLNKTRLSGTEVKIAPATMDCKGKNILIVDDMISTGGTIMTAAKALKDAGAKSVSVACTHGVFASGAMEKLTHSELDKVLCCNTLENPLSKISVAAMFADAIRRS